MVCRFAVFLLEESDAVIVGCDNDVLNLVISVTIDCDR